LHGSILYFFAKDKNHKISEEEEGEKEELKVLINHILIKIFMNSIAHIKKNY